MTDLKGLSYTIAAWFKGGKKKLQKFDLKLITPKIIGDSERPRWNRDEIVKLTLQRTDEAATKWQQPRNFKDEGYKKTG
jgi:hypothetical protein